MTKWCVKDGGVKDGVSKMVVDKVACERWCERWGVTKLGVKGGVCGKVVCERWCVKDGG